MARISYTSIIMRGWSSIVLFAVLGLVLAVVISFLRPLEYSSTIRLLIIENIGTVDAYTAARSSERIAEDLATITYTTSFYEKVMDAGFGIDESYMPTDDYKRRKKWDKMISTTVARGTGLLTIKTYHTDVEQAERIAHAIAFVLTNEGWTYTSGGSITVRLVDEPLNSRWPSKPNIPANAFAGAVLGGLLGMVYVMIQAERIKRRHQLVHEG
jgi:capsular polysaccharide biosynthesis protein